MIELAETKVDISYSITFLNRTSEWHLIRCGFKNGCQTDVSLKEIRLCAQNMIIVLGSIVNIIGRDLYDHLMSMKTFALRMITIFI